VVYSYVAPRRHDSCADFSRRSFGIRARAYGAGTASGAHHGEKMRLRIHWILISTAVVILAGCNAATEVSTHVRTQTHGRISETLERNSTRFFPLSPGARVSGGSAPLRSVPLSAARDPRIVPRARSRPSYVRQGDNKRRKGKRTRRLSLPQSRLSHSRVLASGVQITATRSKPRFAAYSVDFQRRFRVNFGPHLARSDGCVSKARLEISRSASWPDSHVSRYRVGRLRGAISSLVFEKGYLHKHSSTITRLPSSKQLLSCDFLSLFLSLSLFFRKLPFTLRVNIYAERIARKIDFTYSLYLTPLNITRVPR